MISKSIFKLTFVALAAGASLSVSFAVSAQYNPNIQQNFQPNQSAGFQDAQNYMSGVATASAASAAATYQNPAAQFLQSSAPASGYTNDGTLFMGGQRIGNPHQILHDAQIPSFMTITANRYTYTNDPNHGQGALAQMETATTAGSGSDMLLNRLYLTPNNPYVGLAAGPYPNLQTYADVIRDAQRTNYLPTAADDGKIYVFKTLSTASTQSQNILIKELPNTSQFRAAADPLGGGVGVRVTQNGDAVALSNYLATVKPYDFSWQSAFGPYAAMANYGGPVVFGADGNVNGINPYLDPASFYFNWVMGSDQVKSFQNQLNQESKQSGNESFGQLAWDSNTNQYVMLSANNQTATPNSVSGTYPTLGAGQTGVFGMHTHPNGSEPSGQDLRQAAAAGTDQVILGGNGWNYVVMPGSSSTGSRSIDFTYEQWQQILPRVLPYVLPGSAALVGGSKLTHEQQLETARKLNESWNAGWNSFVSWVTGSSSSSNIVVSSSSSGGIDAVRGAQEWGRNNGVGATEGKRRFHDIKKGDPLSRADDDYKVDPETGDVIDPEGEVIGNLNDPY